LSHKILFIEIGNALMATCADKLLLLCLSQPVQYKIFTTLEDFEMLVILCDLQGDQNGSSGHFFQLRQTVLSLGYFFTHLFVKGRVLNLTICKIGLQFGRFCRKTSGHPVEFLCM
jgi:hypothetical protein